MVRKGDVLLKLETDKLDRTIADLRADLRISEVAIHQGQDQLQAMEKAVPLELKVSQRAARVAEEDRKFFFDVAKPFNQKAIAFELKVAKESLEYQQEELRQLEKMYKADDITEETEEIVLRRARDTVERAKFWLEVAQLSHNHALKFDLPRKEEEVNKAAKRTSLEWEKNRVELPLALQKLRLELDKQRLAAANPRSSSTGCWPTATDDGRRAGRRNRLLRQAGARQAGRRNRDGRNAPPPRQDPAEPGGDDRGRAAADVHPRDGPGEPVARPPAGLPGTAVPTGYPDWNCRRPSTR